MHEQAITKAVTLDSLARENGSAVQALVIPNYGNNKKTQETH
jgi:hypothetical protein